MSTESTFDARTTDTRQVTQWLEVALDGYFKDNLGRWAFRPFEQHIGARDDLADDLCAIYDSLAAPVQAHWRSAIRDLLAIHARDITKRKATRVLIALAVLVRSPDVLDVLPGILSGSEDDELLGLTVRAAVALASQTEASRKCLERIRTSPAFTSHYAGLILVALCHSDPDNWVRHVGELVVPMRKLASRLSEESTALRFYASNILDAIGLSRITNATLSQLTADSSADWGWLAKEWLEGNDSLLCVKPTATNTQLVLRADNAVSAELEGPLDRTAFTIHGLQTRRKTAIVWEGEESKTWVAVCSGRLTELTLVNPSRQELIAFIGAHVGEQIAARWDDKVQASSRGGIVFVAPDESFPIASEELRALWDKDIGDRFTDRVDYLRKYRQLIEPTHRRKAVGDPKAFSATASALALAPT